MLQIRTMVRCRFKFPGTTTETSPRNLGSVYREKKRRREKRDGTTGSSKDIMIILSGFSSRWEPGKGKREKGGL